MLFCPNKHQVVVNHVILHMFRVHSQLSKEFSKRDGGVIVASKSDGGDELRALERPGLWNGAMADWNTVFVEIPILTFTPVKTVNDLFQNSAVHVRTAKAPPDGSQVGTKDKTWYHVVHKEYGSVTKTPIARLTPVTDFSGEKR